MLIFRNGRIRGLTPPARLKRLLIIIIESPVPSGDRLVQLEHWLSQSGWRDPMTVRLHIRRIRWTRAIAPLQSGPPLQRRRISGRLTRRSLSDLRRFDSADLPPDQRLPTEPFR